MCWVTGLKIIGRVGTFFFWKKNIILCIFKGILPFKCIIIIYFFRKPEKNSRCTPVNLGRVGLPLNTGSLFGLSLVTSQLFPQV